MLAAVALLTGEQFVRSMGNSFDSVRDTLAHLHGADEVWLQRWNGESPAGLPPATRFADFESLRAAWTELGRRLQQFVGGLDSERLERSVSYRAFNGQNATIPLWQLLQHVVNHGSYHRGQVTTLLRQLEVAPPAGMDLVAFYRERSAR
ncbi:MAG: DinB family protein [Planctomycetes bacterium]|nr:DinB family protein [Planctomycetota bacterium]